MTLRTANLVSVFTDEDTLEDILGSKVQLVDAYADQVDEYMQLSGGPEPTPSFVHYPWQRSVVKTLQEDAYRLLRSNRNRDLITRADQDAFANTHIAFAGLNAGNPGAVCVALEGGSRNMRLADPDTLSLSNLNRFRASLSDVGLNKALLTARQILEVDPYFELEVLESGISPDSLDSFLEGIDILVEEMDALPLKILIRERAKARRIPVIMVTGNGPGVIIDIERYDLDADTQLLNGYLDPRVRDAVISDTYAQTSPSERIALARDFMGANALHPRLLSSFEAVGTSLVGIPQLAESSFLRGAAICHAARLIRTGSVASGRYSLSLEKTVGSAL